MASESVVPVMQCKAGFLPLSEGGQVGGINNLIKKIKLEMFLVAFEHTVCFHPAVVIVID